ncbi:MAG: cupin domain-containing protein [Oribacterium sp.]|nr:cupin domain-containing protein [Oribacterium sp.]
MAEILNYEFGGEGMHRVYENEKWTVGIKNWKPANDITGISNVERHNTTDEMFVLVEGKCTLVFGNENASGGLDFEGVRMEKGKLYVIPKSLWHNTITEKDTKMFLIEDSNCSNQNSDVRDLSPEEIEAVKALV